MDNLLKKLRKIKVLQPQLAVLSLTQRNKILLDLGKLLKKNKTRILKANALDLKNLKRQEMRDRLILNKNRLQSMVRGLGKLVKLPDPLNQVLETRRPKNGLLIKKVSMPLGVLGVIYESRPNVTVDLAGLALKSGNALVLKGGSEAYRTNQVLVSLIRQALKNFGLNQNLVYLINPKIAWQKTLLSSHGLVDVLIPRGSEALIRWVRENSRLPVIETGAGVCHTFVDENYNPKTAAEIIFNAKTQRPDVCNALDTLVIHRAALKSVLPMMAKRFLNCQRESLTGLSKIPFDNKLAGVEIFADPSSFQVLRRVYPKTLLHHARLSDYGKEFLALKMSVKTVKSFEQGLKFVQEKTSGHSEAILSNNQNHCAQFFRQVDAATVYANASTRFTDGEEFGMGAEVGVSTQKLHARGPMGLEALTSYKWEITGHGQARK